MSPTELKTALSSGLLSFPLTDFDSALRFDPRGYAKRLEWLMPYGASVLFAAGAIVFGVMRLTCVKSTQRVRA